ncbi:MAG TPA: hypothetical protein VF169_16615 [Albitalea sp.]|uniref:RCC1 domain-containing protein n=1 Tax=Piscinibacter sp. TaxID=1903157 RepID=UPI002ED4AD58
MGKNFGRQGLDYLLIGCRAAMALTLAGAVLQATAQVVQAPLVILQPPAPEDFVQISAGLYHTCARKQNGKTYCWGYNEYGQVGTGEVRVWDRVSRRYVTLPVARPRLVVNTKQVAAGGFHTCAVGSDDRALCWGLNTSGQVGDASGNDHLPLPQAVADGRSFTALSGGVYGSCGTTTTGLFCWGNITNTTRPMQMIANTDFKGVSVGGQHACVVHTLDSSRAYCWGVNLQQQTGVDPAAWNGPVPFAFQSSLGQNTLALSAGINFTCADKGDGHVWCHGTNGWGELGAGDFTDTFQARRVGNGGLPLHGVAAGGNHACALDSSSRAWCWGNGNNGELGHGATAIASTPQAVAGGRTYRAVAAGYLHSCAIGTDNHIYCWGSNAQGQLGVGSAGSWNSTPMQAMDPID